MAENNSKKHFEALKHWVTVPQKEASSTLKTENNSKKHFEALKHWVTVPQKEKASAVMSENQVKRPQNSKLKLPSRNQDKAELPKQPVTQSKRDLVEQRLRAYDGAMNNAKTQLDEIFSQYGGIKDVNGGIAFPTQEGVQAYNDALKNKRELQNRAYTETVNKAAEMTQKQSENSRSGFEIRYQKTPAGKVYDLETAVGNYLSYHEMRTSFEKKHNYAGNKHLWSKGKYENQYKALLEAEKKAFGKMRLAASILRTNDVDKNDPYYQLAEQEYNRAMKIYELDEYLDKTNLKLVYSGDDSDVERQMREKINSSANKNQVVEQYEQAIGQYDKAIKELNEEGRLSESELLKLQVRKLEYELEDKAKLVQKGEVPKAGSEADWIYFTAAILSSHDFAEKSKADPKIKNPKYEKEVKEPKDENEKLYLAVNGGKEDTLFMTLPTFMTDEEVSVFNYLYQSDNFGPSAAKSYYDEIIPDLKERSDTQFDYIKAKERAKLAGGDSYALQLAYSGLTGLADAVLGMVQWIPGTEDWNESNNKALQFIHGEQGYGKRMGLSAAQSVGGMLPAIAVGNIAGVAGGAASAVGAGATTFLSSGGQAAAEGRKMGMSAWQAVGYGAAVGGAEAGLEWAIGGIPGLRKVGGMWDELAAKATTKGGKIAARFVGSAAGEVLEENIQNYIEPAARCLVGFDAWEDYDAPDIQDFVDTTISTIIASGVMNTVNLKNDADLTKYEMEVVKPWIDEALKISKRDTTVYALASDLKKKMDSGKRITPNVFQSAIENATQFDMREQARIMTEQEIVERRAEKVQEANPEAQVVTSAIVQSYIDQGIPLQTANRASEVLDKIASGEITSENISPENIDKLQLHIPAMADVVAKTLGIVLPKISTKAEARNVFRQAIRQLEANKNAQSETTDYMVREGESTEAHGDTADGTAKNVSQLEIEPIREPVRVTPIRRTVSQTEAEAPQKTTQNPIAQEETTRETQIRATDAMGFTDFYNELNRVNGAVVNDAVALQDYFDEYKIRVDSDPSVMTPAAFAQDYIAKNPKAKNKAIMRAYQEYLSLSTTETKSDSERTPIDYTKFAEQYRHDHPNATVGDIALAYQEHLGGDVKHDAKSEYGVIENEYSDQVDSKIVAAIDSIAKLFRVNIEFGDFGNEANGKFFVSANKIVLDIHPDKAFAYVAGHEITHYVRSKSGNLVWKAFERYAVKAMGGNDAVAKKQAFDEAYKKASDAREEVACDFVGEMISNPQVLSEFCKAIESWQVNGDTAKGTINAFKAFFGRFTNKTSKADAELVEKVKEVFGVDIENATKAIKALQTAYQKATRVNALVKKKNTIEDSGTVKKNTKVENITVAEATADGKITSGIAKAIGKDGVVLEDGNGNVAVVAKKSDHGIDAVIADPSSWDVKYSKKTWQENVLTDESGNAAKGKDLFINLMKESGYSDSDIAHAVKRMENLLDLLTNEFAAFSKLQGNLEKGITTNLLDEKQRVLYSLISNGDYPINGELSTTCVNRQAFQTIYKKLVDSGVMSKVVFNSEAIGRMNEILRNYGYLTACFSCFVETRRARVQTWAENFVSTWNKAVAKYESNGTDVPEFGFFDASKNASSLADGKNRHNLLDIENQLTSVEKNDKGNVMLGKGNLETRIGRLLDKVPALRKTLVVEDIMSVEALTAMRRYGEGGKNIFALLRSSYGSASPKISQDFEAYGGDFAKLSFEYVKEILGSGITGANTIVKEIAEKKTAKYFEGKNPSEKEYAAKLSEFKDSKETKTEALREYLFRIAGIRYQSFSDFDITQVFDKMQLFNDIAALKAPVHEYTKVVSDVRIFGMCGAKENMSVIHQIDPTLGEENAGLVRLANGELGYVADDRRHYEESGKGDSHRAPQSIDFKDAVALLLDPRYAPNIGTTAIGFSVKHIEMMLDDARICMIIPYHSSGMPALYKHLTGMTVAKDFTNDQTASVKKTWVTTKDGKMVSIGSSTISKSDAKKMKDIAQSWKFAEHLYENGGDPRKTAKEYIEWCASDHVYTDRAGREIHFTVKPIFEQFANANHKNYYKVLVDFNPYDIVSGKLAPQGSVGFSYAGDSAKTTLTDQQLAEYKKRLEAEGIFDQKDIEKYMRWAKQNLMDIIREEMSKEQRYIESTSKYEDIAFRDVRKMLLDDFARGSYSEAEAKQEIGAKDAEKEPKYPKKFVRYADQEVKSDKKAPHAAQSLETKYLEAIDRGDMEIAQRMVDEAANEAFSHSKIRDENGKLIPVYHGTKDTFYIFDTSVKGGVNGTAEGFGIYTSDDPEVTAAYGDRQIKMFANISKPARDDKKTITLRELTALIKNTCEKQAQQAVEDGEYESTDDALYDTWISNYVYTYDLGMERSYKEVANNILRMNDNDMAIIQEVMAGLAIRDYASATDFYQNALTPVTGFDGFVAHWENQNTGKKSNIILALNSNQLKSAEPITYDDDGKVIPLSKRFNADDPDIRYDKKTAQKAESTEVLLGTDEGKQAYAERYGMKIETEGQAQRAAARDAQRADEAKQKAQSAEVAKEAEALIEEKMQKAAEDKMEEHRKKYFTPPKKQKAPDLSEMSREELQAGILKAERNLRLERLKKENAQRQLKRTNGSKVDSTGVHSFARKLVKDYDYGQVSNERVQAITKSMVETFDRAAEIYDKLNDAEASAMIVLDYAQKLSEEIVQEAKVYEIDPYFTEYAQYDELRKVLKSTTFFLPKRFASDVSPEFGKWKNRYFGKFNVKLVDGNEGNIDSIYDDLAENYPEFFRDHLASEPDLLLQIAKVADRINSKEEPRIPLWKIATEADVEIITADIETKVLIEFMRVAEKPRLKTKMDTVVERFEKKLSALRSEMKAKSAKAVSDAVKKEAIKNERETLRIVKYYENQLDRIENNYEQKIEKIENQARRKAKKAELERTFEKDDARKKYQELDRNSKRKIERLRNEKQAQIDRLKRIARQNAIARTRKGAEGLRAIQKAWQDRGENFRILDGEQITTKTKSTSENKAKDSKATRLKNFYKEARRAFVTDIVDIEDFAREQNRPDNANVMATMYKNSGATVAAIHEEALYSPSGDVVDSRSLAEVALCWKNDKANGEIDEAGQRVFEEYLYHRHGADRMSIEYKARLALDDFIYEHPEFDPSSFPHYSQKEILSKASDGDENAVRYIELARNLAEVKNKPVMGAESGVAVNATTHEMIYKDIEAKAPWVKQKAEELYGWWDKFMNTWVVGAELSEDQYKRMKEMYPHYVPTYRAFEKNDKGVFITNKDGTKVKRSIRVAKGSTMDLMQVENSLAVQVAKIVEARRFNDLALNIVHEALFAYDPSDVATESGQISDYVLFADDYSSNDDMPAGTDDYTMRTENADKRRLTEDNDTMLLTAFENGVPIRAYVSKGLKKSLDALTGAYDPFAGLVKWGNRITGLQKAAITGYNPFFAGRNVPRDFVLANVNSVAGLAFAKYETLAIKKMAQGDEDWQRFKALGGTESTQYEAEKGFAKNISKQKSLGAKTGSALGAFNNATESMTRFAEYLATIERVGDTPEGRVRAIKNAAEVTVDFSRHGTVGKVLNAWIPYWNPQIQGMSRLMRSVFEAKDVKTALKTLGKATAVSVLPEALFQALLYALGGYDDWEELDDRTKDAYYAVPIGDGKFIKIAKGREWAQVIGNPLMRLWQGLNGREDPFENYWETSIAANFMLPSEISLKGVLDTVGVTDAVILSQVIDLETNKDFAGRTIVPYEYQEGSAKEQYDENTSWLAKIIGRSFGLSPMKIDYIIGDYFGDFGDMLIEATNENDTTFGNKFLDTLLNSFVADNAYSSETNSDYYEMIDDLTVAVSDKKLRDPDYKNSVEYKTQQAIDSYYQSKLKDLRDQSKKEGNDSTKRAITLEMRGWQADALDFYDKCMAGEIKEPELYIKYLQYGSTTRDELIRLNKFNGEDYDYSFVPSIDVPKIGDHKNTDEEKASYKTMYTNQYATLAENVISSFEYQKASDEEKCSMLEGVKELAYFYAKREYATKFGLTSKNYDPETEENKLDNLMEAGATFAEAYNTIHGIDGLEPSGDAKTVSSLQKWSQIVSDKSLDDSVVDAALRNVMSTEQLAVYDRCHKAGVSPRAYVKVHETIAKTKPIEGNKNVNTQQKLEICCKTVSDPKQQDALVRSFLSESALKTYDRCRKAGVTAKQYVSVQTNINKLKPIGNRDSIALGQKLEVCINATYNTKAQDALIRMQLDKESEEKYDSCVKVGITPRQYAEYQMAKITYAGGSWSKSELENWMSRHGFSSEQKRVLKKATNKNW